MFKSCNSFFQVGQKQKNKRIRTGSIAPSRSNQKNYPKTNSLSNVNFQNQLIINYTFADPQINSQKPCNHQMRQQVINYECDVIHKKVSCNQLNLSVNDSHSHRYGTWRLQEIIQQFANKFDYCTKWIGCDSHAHALSFFYCMLLGCLQDDSTHDDLFIKFKYSLYQQSKQALSIMDQKIFIQHLGLIQDSKNIGQFLKKSSHLQPIFIKIFSTRCSLMIKKNLKNNVAIKPSKMEQLQWFSTIFPFCSFMMLSQNCSNITINKQSFFIIQQKQCFFVLEQANKLASCMLSQISTRKKIKTQVYGYGLQYIDSLKSFELLDSKHETTRDLDKYKKINTISKSQSKQILSKAQQNKISKESTPQQISTLVQLLPKQQTKNSIHQEKKREKGNFFTKSFTKQSKQFEQKQKIVIQNNLRSSIRDEKQFMSFGTPKITSQRVSVDKQPKSKSKHKKLNEKQKMIFSVPIDVMPQISQHQNTNRHNSRQDFIYQSLNPNQHPAFKKQSTQKFESRVPKFLSKRNDQAVPFTFSNSPIKGSHTPTRNQVRRQKKAPLTYQQVALPITFAANTPKQQNPRRKQT